MQTTADPDVVVIGAGQNGLTAAAVLTGAGLRVLVLEANNHVGGAVRTAEATLPGFRHDLCSGFYPLAQVGPIRELPLREHGLEWCHFARPFGGGTPDGPGVAVARRDPGGSAASFEAAHAGDGDAYEALWRAWRQIGPGLLALLFNPLGDPVPALRLGARMVGFPPRWHRPFELARLLVAASRDVATERFAGQDARTWFVGSPQHSDMAPETAGGGMYGLIMLGLAQTVGMPIPRGGAVAIAAALRRLVESRGGEVQIGKSVTEVIVRDGRAVAVRTSDGHEYSARYGVIATAEPKQLIRDLVDNGHLPRSYVQAVRRWRFGTGVFKLDLALSGLPTFRSSALQDVGVLHLCDSVEAASAAANAASRGFLPASPLLIAGIHTLADPSRAPDGHHTVWIETHAPAHLCGDAAGEIDALDWRGARERFADRLVAILEGHAPGITQLVIGRHIQAPPDLHAMNRNLVGGDNMGGSVTLDQQLVLRPVPGWFRHRTPVRGLYLGGASSHPGGGVHGACGSNAARILLRDLHPLRRLRSA